MIAASDKVAFAPTGLRPASYNIKDCAGYFIFTNLVIGDSMAHLEIIKRETRR